MLSPDIPEFVPRNCQNPESSASDKCISQDYVTLGTLQEMHPTPSHTSYPSSAKACHNADQVLSEDRSGRVGNKAGYSSLWNEASASNTFQSRRGAYKPDFHTSRGNWRSSDSEKNWKSPDEGDARVRQKKLPGNSSVRSMDREGKQNWRERDYQNYTHGEIQGSRWRSTRAPFAKRTATTSSDSMMTPNSVCGLENIASTLESRTALQVTQDTEEQIVKEVNTSGSMLGEGACVDAKQKPAQRKTDPRLTPRSAVPDASEVNQKAKVERTELPFQVKHDTGNVSYRKILSRKSNSATLQTKIETSPNLIPSHSEEQWPSLSVPHPGTPVGKSGDGNGWAIVNNTEPPAVWPRAFPTREATTSLPSGEASSSQNSPRSDLSNRKKSKNTENLNLKMDKATQRILHNPTDKRFPQTGEAQTKDFYKKKGRVKQGDHQRPNNDYSGNKGKIEFDNRKGKSTLCKSQTEGTVGPVTEKKNIVQESKSNSNSGRVPQNCWNSEKIDMTQSRYSEPSTNKHTVTSEENSKLEPTEACASLTENEASQWQVMKKKKSKVREQKGDLMAVGEGNSQHISCEYGSEKSKYQKNSSRVLKHRDTGTERRGSGVGPTRSKQPEDKDHKIKQVSISSKTDQHTQRKHFNDNGDFDTKGTFTEDELRNDSSCSTPGHRIKTFAARGQLPSKRGGRKGGGVDHLWRDSSDAKDSETSELFSDRGTKDPSVSGNSKDSQKISISSAEKKSTVESEVIQKAKLKKKAKMKEEKMRKREAKLKQAQAQMTADSKVTLVNKELLEMMYGGKKQQERKSTSCCAIFEMRDQYKEPSHINDKERFHLSLEEYPSIMRGRSKVPTETECQGNPAHSSGSRGYYESCSGEEDYRYTDEESRSTTSQKLPSDLQISRSPSKSLIVADNASKDDPLEDRVNQSKKMSAVNIPERGNDSTEVHTKDALPSYSRALLTSAKSKVVSQKPQVKVTSPKVAAPKKKVKTKDEITFDIMDAVIKKVKKPKSNVAPGYGYENSKNSQTPTGKKGGEKSLADGLPKTKKNPTVSTEVVKRGRQREVPKKKKLSPIKRAIKKAKQMEVENLLSVLQEAKKLQENSMPEDASLQPCSVPNVPLSNITCTITSKGADQNQVDSQEKSSEKNLPPETRLGDDKVDNVILSTPVLDNRDVVTVKDSEFLHDSHEESSCNPSEDKEKKNEEVQNNVNLKENQEIQNNMNLKENQEIQNDVNLNVANSPLDPEFSQKCMMIVDDLKVIQNSVHSKTFREYCNHVVTPEVNSAAGGLIHTLVGFQERHYQRDPVKARIRRRYICGLRVATKSMGKLSCIIMAPDILRCKGPGALDELVEKVLSLAEKQGVPVIFALSRKQMARLCLKKAMVSCVGIISYHGAQDIFHKLMELIPEAKRQYQDLVARGSRTIPVGDEPPDEEFVPGSDSISEVSVVSKDTLSAVSSEERSANTCSVPSSTNTREEVIASMVAILSDK